jgi:peptidoglycan hydrolase-like protein with peptidoglycan-binding domain
LALQSRLFVGDTALEAAAASDAAHIVQGSSGPHVRKIQTGLNLLDDAKLNADGSYGRLTAAAVLNYKRARAIINTARQTEADDIVGRMTIAALDAELVVAESPKGPIRIKPVFTAAGGHS